MSEETKDLLLGALYEQEAARPRSQQVELGPSSLGSCKRQVVYKLMGVEPINEAIKKLPSIMGTAIHETIERALRNKGHNSVELTGQGIEGLIAAPHIDFYREDQKKVVDWKTTKKSNQRYFPSLSQRWQVHTYGYLLKRSGYEVEVVELVSIARDGTEDDIKVHTEPYDESVALDGLKWLEDRIVEAVNGELPEPEKFGNFCKNYCPFYGEDLCLGKQK